MSPTIPTKFFRPKAIAGALIGIVILIGLFARGGTTSLSENLKETITCEEGEWDGSPYYSGDTSNCPDIIEYVFKVASVDEVHSDFLLRFITEPAGLYGMSMKNSGWVLNSYFVDVDTTDYQRIINSDGSSSKGATLRVKLSDRNALFAYPFDRYSGEIKAQSGDLVTKELIPGVVRVSTSTLAGWKIGFEESLKPSPSTGGKALYEDGRITLNWSLSRANVVFIAVFILLALMLIALGSAFALTRSIGRGKRPPSMNLLLWIATVLFAILQVRSNFPGNPPIGILLDFAVVFPVLGLLLILGIVNTVFWLQRSDWDYENEPVLGENLD